MYQRHFQLQHLPFGLTPDTRFFVPLQQHQDVLAVLKTALNAGEGFIKISGEVGSGKTLLCRMLLQQAEPDWQLAYLPDPCLTPLELRWALALELGLHYSGNIDPPQLLQLLQRQLMLLAAQGKKTIILLDEAQALPDDTLEALRLLTNLETEQRKLLQVVLFGQPELNSRLGAYRFRQLRQRITFSSHLSLMSRKQVTAYLRQRISQAGATVPLFRPAAEAAICRYSRGIPRLVNVLAHKALLLAFGEGRAEVTAQHVRLAALDTEDVSPKPKSWWWYSVVAAALLTAGVAVAACWPAGALL
ncbi:MAG: AAA family ATPase [Gammaproteobacteria bacterium]|nr:AAA family ATPase [Gammaproteobacteria bacterium]MBU1553305.1 AAA family ATPase [Gammaproteobacteria bacterium]MBU2070849.1 AAA family ATPase [Gammaproteobacteria bacterium]MBU2182840.1 AAA family ATPase [Gammaproteobacteria bacterium]MBU2203605.1 AAA family ATPase [Gammaproteobacteria bacterium]